MIQRIFEFLLQISIMDNDQKLTKHTAVEQFILWIYFFQLNGFLVMDQKRNSNIVQENQYMFTILSNANIITEAVNYFSLDFLLWAILLFLIVILVAVIICSILKLQVKYEQSIPSNLEQLKFIFFILIGSFCVHYKLFLVNLQASGQGQTTIIVSQIPRIILQHYFQVSQAQSQYNLIQLLQPFFLKKEKSTKLIYSNIILQNLSCQVPSQFAILLYQSYIKRKNHKQQCICFIVNLPLVQHPHQFYFIKFRYQAHFSIYYQLFGEFRLKTINLFSLLFLFLVKQHFDILQLLWYVVDSMLKRKIQNIIQEFCIGSNNCYLVQSIEYFICEQSQSIELLIQLLIHKNNCLDVLCPCKECQVLDIDRITLLKGTRKQKTQKKFILKKWILHLFKNQLRGKQIKYYNQQEYDLIILNYLSFQRFYLENHVLTCKTIYQCIEIKKQFQKKEKKFDVTSTILYLIWQKCRVNLMSQSLKQIKISQQEYFIITDINILYTLGDSIIQSLQQVLVCQKKLWEDYQKNQLINFDHLLNAVEKVQKLKKVSRIQFEEYQKYRNQTKETIYSLKIKLLYYLIIYQDLKLTLKIQQQLNELESAYQYDININNFNDLSFLTGSALSIISNISPEHQGRLEQKITTEFKQFFGFSEEDGQPFTHIKDLMPSKLGNVHSGLVENFFFKGQSDRINNSSLAFILNKKNLIEQVKLCLSYFFPVNLRELSFYMIAHIQKTSKVQQNQQDQNLKGHLLLDKEFKIFGMTQNLYQKLNYKYYYKRNQDVELITPEEIYNNCSIFSIIPQLQSNLQNYYEKMQGGILRENEVIFVKEKGLMKINIQPNKQQKSEQKPDLKRMSLSKLTNKKLLLHVIEQAMMVQNSQADQNTKYYPIEFTLTQRILHPYSSEQNLESFLYYLIEIEFLEDFNVQIEQQIKSKQFLKQQQVTSKNIDFQRGSTILQYQFDSVNLITSDKMISHNGEEQQMIQEPPLNNNRRKSQMKFIEYQHHLQEIQSQNSSIINIPNRIHKFFEFLQDNRYPSVFIATYGIVSIHLLMTIVIIALICAVYFLKKVIQSNCIINSTEDINYFNGYSSVLSGSRHMIFNSNFQTLFDPIKLKVDNGIITITSTDRINISWDLLVQGSQGVIGKFQIYSNILQTYEDVPVNLSYPDFSNLQVKSQTLNNFATHYTTLYQLLYMTFQNDVSLNMYLQNNNESNIGLRNRYFLYFNYQNIISVVNQSLYDCNDYNDKINGQYDQLVSIIFVLIYCIALLFGMFHGLAIFRLKKVIQIYLNQFITLEFDECEFIIDSYDRLQNSINQDNLLVKQNHFDQIKLIPTNILTLIQYQETNQMAVLIDNNKNQNNKNKSAIEAKKMFRNSPTLSIRKYIIVYLILVILKISFSAVFQIYYDYVASGIAPATTREIEAQLMRLNFIITINLWDTYLLKQFYYENNYFNYSNQNIQNNQQLFSLLEIDKAFLLNQIKLLQAYDLTDLLYRNAKEQNQNLLISEQNKQILIGKDVCLLIGCNMSSELLKNRVFSDVLLDYYQIGLMQLLKNTLQVIIEYEYLISDESLTPEQRTNGIFQMHNSNNYLLYIFYGLDATQYQISWFCQYFLNLTISTLNKLTESNIIYILIFGIPMLLFTLYIEIYVILSFSQKFDLGRESIRQIPLETLFQKGIPKKLCYLMRKYK
ncbi:unnamed protein product (macronuclear) [Paramecium tetraurelia]|uniref:Transmembrane protein n=1 Tax=Paramecium tetraurelia TaxID=5888 RepID=A0DHT3_PARTE|nr:uncharacterized protein GSPATT00016987001 [Paramecium tetraurelia]CAK82600.1 unnamed protein product [Paramecium tetraurelia]|eukprot:XP_001449997.1 hypothetical protein (macronuclear) [Paramecium tetraurelia strain d4-2]